MKYIWQDLPKPLNCFTVRDASKINLNTGKVIQYYSANTKIVVVQKCITSKCTYYRTREAAHHYLNYAFEASAFGLPNEKAPSAHFSSEREKRHTPIISPTRKQTKTKMEVSPDDGAGKKKTNWFFRFLRRKNG